ncbi:unnamed protein product [Leptidea sinapis]|uniref:Major facilitator superfamily (MFS) profile domain-containing protein n=1 Tax=Leptidea sinapis TaxID=189913 RepID=A0A5E4PQW4_9NEOP|nr:unnamed protein product [Leptidea sinapis]
MLSDIVEHSKQLFMFNRFDEWSRTHDNAEADICQVTAYVTKYGTHSTDARCDPHIHSDVFMESLITVAAAIPIRDTNNLIVSAIFSSVISCGNASLDCLITEVFPTNLRATGVAVSMVAARLGGIIGNVVIAALLDTYCPAPTFIVAVLLAGGGLMCLFLPNTTRQALK